jgi:hypothetical protein
LANNGDFKIVEAEPDSAPINLEKDRISAPDEPVSISLKYYRPQTECFSKWTSQELKKFTGLIAKIRGHTATNLKAYTALCDRHKGKPSEDRFSRPVELSEDLALYELKVDPSNKARVHGVFVGSVFFLIWLDRKHAVFKS